MDFDKKLAKVVLSIARHEQKIVDTEKQLARLKDELKLLERKKGELEDSKVLYAYKVSKMTADQVVNSIHQSAVANGGEQQEEEK